MKILEVNQYFPPEYSGGTEIYLYNLVEVLSKKHAVKVATTVKAFAEILEREKPDVVHFHSFFYNLPLNLPKIAKQKGVPTVLTLHDHWLLCHKYPPYLQGESCCKGANNPTACIPCILRFTPPLLIPTSLAYRFRGAKRFFKNIDIVITPSEYMKNKLLEFNVIDSQKVVCITHGLNTKSWEGFQKMPSDRIRFGYIGGTLYGKGIKTLIEAFNKLGREDFLLYIYGSSSSKKEEELYKNMAQSKNIKFMGHFLDLKDAFANIDVLIVPSLDVESFSLAVREGFLFGLPVIASRIGGISEAIKDGINGFLFEPANAEELKNIVNKILNQPRLIEHLKGNIPKIKSMEEHVLEIEAIYNKAIEETVGTPH